RLTRLVIRTWRVTARPTPTTPLVAVVKNAGPPWQCCGDRLPPAASARAGVGPVAEADGELLEQVGERVVVLGPQALEQQVLVGDEVANARVDDVPAGLGEGDEA